MRLLHVIGNLGYGGAQSVLYYLVGELQRHPDVEIDVCSLQTPGHWGRRLLNRGVEIIGLDRNHLYNPWIAFLLDSLVARGRYDVVHVHLFPELVWGAYASLRNAKAVWVYTEHNEWNHRRKWPILRLLERPVYQRYNHIIAVGERTKETLLAWQPQIAGRVSVVHNCVDLQAFVGDSYGATSVRQELGIADGTKLVLYIGRLVHAKGVDVLIRAASLLDVSCDWLLLIVGEGEDRQSLVRLSESLDLQTCVRFPGVRSDVSRLMAASEVVVVPSRWEGIPLVVLEALAAGKPVVATLVGGIPEVVRSGVDGILVPPENPELLAGAIAGVLEDAEVARRLGLAAKERSKDFSVQTVADRLLGLYTELLESKGRLGGKAKLA